MAIVPGARSLSNVQIARAPQQGPTALANANTFGAQIGTARAGLGQAVQNVGEQAAAITLDIQKRENMRQLKEADIEFSKAERLLMSGDGTEENPGFLNLPGKRALNSAEATRSQVLELQKTIGKGLTRTQRERWQAISAERTEALLTRMDTHTARQRFVADAATAKARGQEANDRAAIFYNDPVEMGHLFAVRQAEALAEGMALGMGEEAALSYAQQQVSGTAVTAIEAAIASGDTAQAKHLLAQYSKASEGADGQFIPPRLDGSDIPALKKKLQAGVVQHDSARAANLLFAKFPSASAADTKARLKFMRDPSLPVGVRDALIKRVGIYNAEVARAEALASSQAMEVASQQIAQGVAPADVDTSRLTVTQMKTLDVAHARFVNNVPFVTDWDEWDKILLQPQKWKDLPLDTIRQFLADEQFAIAQRLKVNANNPTSGKHASQQTQEQIFKERTAGDFGVTSAAKKKRGEFQTLFDRHVAAVEDKSGVDMTSTELHELMDKLLGDLTLRGEFFGGPGPFFDDTDPFFEQVEEISDKFRKANPGLTDVQLLDAFALMLERRPR